MFDKCATAAVYLTLGLGCVWLIVRALTKKFRPEAMGKFNSVSLGAAIGYAVGLLGILLYLKHDEHLSAGVVDLAAFVPVSVLLGLIVLLSLVGLILSLFKPNALKAFSRVSLALVSLAFAAFVIAHFVRFYSGKSDLNASKEAKLFVFAILLGVLVVALPVALGKKSVGSRTAPAVFASVSIAMSFALSYIRFLSLPQGGSVTLASLLPLLIYSHMFGIRKGAIAGAIYGFLQFVQSPWFIHPVQFLLDYPIAFGAVGLAGIFRERGVLGKRRALQFLLGALCASLIRYAAHVVSGTYVFGSGDPNFGAVAWSFLYNAFVFADILVAAIPGCVMLKSKSFSRYVDQYSQMPDDAGRARSETRTGEGI